jgi:hypothetical protein
MAYLHLPRGDEAEQDATGTVSLRTWQAEGEPTELRLADGRRLSITVTRDALSECSRNRILRFSAHWPPDGPREGGS